MIAWIKSLWYSVWGVAEPKGKNWIVDKKCSCDKPKRKYTKKVK